MVDLALEQNEHIICRTKEAWRFDGKEERELEFLLLTNKNLISVYKKSVALIFEGKAVVDKKPLSLISMINNIPQVNHIRDENFGEVLQIMYDDGRKELYSFYDAPKSEFGKWKDSIEQAIKENSKTIVKEYKIVDDALVVKKSKQGEESLVAEENNQMEELIMPAENMQGTNPTNTSGNGGMFMFCTSCGEKNNIGAKFCQSCGISLVSENKAKQNSEFDKGNHKSIYSERRQEFVGKIYKCPNCGEVLKSFITNCPSCGFELRGAKVSSTVKEFALKLEEIENRRIFETNKKRSFIARIYGSDGKLTDTDEQKISLIRSFSVPNIKEDILEFMILASSNIDTSIYGWGDKGVITESRKAVSEAWISKMEQVYEKAKLTIGNTTEFQNIEKTYLKKMADIKKRKRGIWVVLGVVYGILFGICALILLISVLSPEPTLEEQIKDRQTHLESVVNRIEYDISEGKYTDARNKAYTLTFDEELDIEKHDYWEQRKQDILEQIEKASGENTD